MMVARNLACHGEEKEKLMYTHEPQLININKQIEMNKEKERL